MLKDTIISAFNYDGTLLKWLKKVEDALQNASAKEFRVNKKGNATISFSIVFANGDTLESGDIILQQGESVTNATIRQGHLILTLSNGDELDAGDVGAVTGFSINESQHLIVTYQNGTIQDLGAIFTGDVNINGNLTVTGNIINGIKLSQIVDSQARPRFIEGDLSMQTVEGITFTYGKWSLSGTHLMIVLAGDVAENTMLANGVIYASANLPTWVLNKIIPLYANVGVSAKTVEFYADNWQSQTAKFSLTKTSNINLRILKTGNETIQTASHFRIEFDLLIDTD